MTKIHTLIRFSRNTLLQESLNLKKPASETTILLDGRQAKYIKYVFTDEDGQLGSIGEIRQVVHETEKGVYELQVPGKDLRM